ncbi:MAG: histidine kinase [Crocinitomicaceae bacterium]|nr:histidine kinase [Crocinitomicaceae bacterium]
MLRAIFPRMRHHQFITLTLHLFFWSVFYFIPFIDRVSNDPYDHQVHFWDGHLLFNHCLFIVLFYTNAHWLIPRFFQQNKPWLYFLILLVFLVVLVVIENLFVHTVLPRPLGPPPVHPKFGPFKLFVPLIFVFFISASYRILLDRVQTDRAQKEKQNQQLKSEVAFLRSQINPHFIFNALNSSIILVRKNDPIAEECLLKLSGLLRYMLYDSDDEKVRLEDEVEYINNYIDLQHIRFGERVKIERTIEIGDGFAHHIEPMLLIPFIENAFKHGTNVVSDAVIFVQLLFQNGALHLHVKNKFTPHSQPSSSRNNGIGLINVQRRLTLLYPEAHTLKVEQQGEWFEVELVLTPTTVL